LKKNFSLGSLTLSPKTDTVTVFELEPTGIVSFPLVATKSAPFLTSFEDLAVTLWVVYERVTGSIARSESVTVKTNAVVPDAPSFFVTSKTTTLHWKRRSCRWFLSPHPLPGFVLVGVVVLVDVLVDVLVVGLVVVELEEDDEELDELEEDEVLDERVVDELVVDELVLDEVVLDEVVVGVVVLVDVVVGVVVVVVLVDVEQYAAGSVQYS
jgi:hypothetical protein